MAEHMSTDSKLRDRIEYLEEKLAKYDDEGVEVEVEKEPEERVDENEVEVERQLLLKDHLSDSDE
jgi:hypothetical protein